jgi:hypothetical protein
MFKLIALLMKNNKLLINILANNFKPKDLRDVIEANNEAIVRFETDLDMQAREDVNTYEDNWKSYSYYRYKQIK